MARSFEQLLLYHWLPKLYKTQTLMHEDIAWGHMNLPRDEILVYDFVLEPLVEIFPEGIHPIEKRSYKEIFIELNTSIS